MSVFVQLLGRAAAAGEYLPVDKRGCLLAHLACSAAWASRDRVAFLFWPDSDEASARRNLRQLISRVKGLPFAAALEIEATRLRWPVSTDVAAFRQAVARREWAKAVEAYGGELLRGFHVEGAEGFNAWLDMEREDLRLAYRQAVLGFAERLEESGAPEVAARHLKALLDDDDLAEDVLRAYLRAAYLAGQRDLALSVFRQFGERLKAELGLEPLPETQRLVAAIAESVPLAIPAAPARASRQVPMTVNRPPALVGREAAVRVAVAASTPAVLLEGEAGVGKTRLMEELAPGALRVRCLEGTQSVPYQPLVETVRGVIADGGVVPDLGAYLEDLARLAPDLVPAISPGPAEPSTAKARLLEALARLFEFLGQGEEGFALAFDDLQWADAGTLDLIALLASRGRVRLLGAYRGHEVTPGLAKMVEALSGSRALTHIELPPLEEHEVRTMLARLIGAEHGPPVFSRWLHERSGGNPMFALETLRSLFENGTLRGDQGGWHTDIDVVTRDYSELETSGLISETIRRRVARLSRDTARALQAAAVIGTRFDSALVGEVAGLNTWAALDALEEANRAGIVDAGRFRHDLLREAIYGSLPAERRTLLHRRAAEALEGGESGLMVAEHWLAAGEPLEACRRWLDAAQQLRDRGLFHEAVPVLERVLRHATGGRTGWEARAALGSLYRSVGRHEEAELLVAELLAGCDEADLRASALETRAGSLLSLGRLDEAARVAREGIDLAASIEHDRLRQSLASLLAHVEIYRGRPDLAFELIEPIVAGLRVKGDELDLCAQLTSLAVVYDYRGDHEKALPLHLEALEIARRRGARYQQVDISLNLLICYMDLKRTQEGLAVAEEALNLGTFEGTATLRNNLAAALADMDRLDDARRHYELLVEESRDPTLVTIAWAKLARLYSRLSRPELVRSALERLRESVADTDFAIARAVAAIALRRLGGAAEKEAGAAIGRTVDRLALPPYVLTEFDEAVHD